MEPTGPNLTDEQKSALKEKLGKWRVTPGPPIVTIFVRHAEDCRYIGDEFCKRCNCRKHLRWSHAGKQYRRKAGTRSWAAAEDAKRTLEDQLAGRTTTAPEAAGGQTIRAAVDAFLLEKKVARIDGGTQRQFKLELNRFASFCETSGVFVVAGIESTLLTEYKATWPELYSSSNTQSVVQQRLKTFLRYCNNARWLTHVPKMSPVRIDENPTRPLTCPRCGMASCVKHKESEYPRLLAAVPDAFANGNAKRVSAIIQLMRWSGLAIRDASCLKRSALTRKGNHYAVTAKRQKIVARVGEAAAPEVCVPIPAEIGREIMAAASSDPEHIFWTPKTCTGVSFAHDRSADISRVFAQAGIECQGGMVSHRLRDTFACSLLEKGVALEDVSRLLGHRSIVTTEKHYSAWAKGRQNRLDSLVTATWD